jgi:hypothetical protein
MIDSMMNEYIDKLKTCFYVNNEIHENDSHVFTHDKPSLVLGLSEKNSYLLNWRKLLLDVGTIPRVRVRDISNSGQRHSYKALLTYASGTSGITLSICFPFKMYGFYYSRLYPAKKRDQYFEKNSYKPLDDKVAVIRDTIENFIIKNFENFSHLNDQYAERKIRKIVIDGIQWENLDLWKAFFTTDMFGII